MAGGNIRWVKVANSAKDIFCEPNTAVTVAAGEKKITIATVGTDVFACAHRCPHAGAVLAEGYVDLKHNIVCPMHGYKFNLVNGRNVSGEGYHLKVFPVREREAGLFVGLEETESDDT